MKSQGKVVTGGWRKLSDGLADLLLGHSNNLLLNILIKLMCLYYVASPYLQTEKVYEILFSGVLASLRH